MEDRLEVEPLQKLEEDKKGLREQVKNIILTLEKFTISSNTLKIIRSQRAHYSKNGLIQGIKT